MVAMVILFISSLSLVGCLFGRPANLWTRKAAQALAGSLKVTREGRTPMTPRP
jgi:hypothetical protein